MTKQERLRLLRLLHGQTQAELAAAAGLKQALITSYERGVCNIPEGSVKLLAPLLGVDPAYLTFGYPAVAGKVWEPAREGKGLAADLAALLPGCCAENHFNRVRRRDYLDGSVFLLSAADRRHCLLFIATPALADVVAHALDALLLQDVPSPALSARFLDQFQVGDFGVPGLKADSFSWPADFGAGRIAPELRLLIDLVADEMVPALVTLLSTNSQSKRDPRQQELATRLSGTVHVHLVRAAALIATQGCSDQTRSKVRREIIKALSS